jgi:hypothetical protein
MDTGSKALIAIGVVLLFMFLGMSMSVYDTRNENKKLHVEIEDLREEVSGNRIFASSVSQAQMRDNLEVVAQLNKNKEKISILDESIDSKDKRWARIKRVRDAIESTTHETPPILELTKVASAIVDYSDQYDVPINVVLAVSKRESNFNRKAVSHAGANGLMQIMPETGKEIAADIGKRRYSLFDIRDNIRFGTYYLKKMLYRFDGDLELAVRAYNCGPTYTEKVVAGEYQNYPEETVKYLEAVLGWKKEYENLGL